MHVVWQVIHVLSEVVDPVPEGHCSQRLEDCLPKPSGQTLAQLFIVFSSIDATATTKKKKYF